MGAVYQAAALSKAFKVKPFLIRDAAVFPIQVSFGWLPRGQGWGEGAARVEVGLARGLTTFFSPLLPRWSSPVKWKRRINPGA